MVAHNTHDSPNTHYGAEPSVSAGPLTPEERRRRALRRLDEGHAALLEALAGLDDAEAFLGSRWSVWEVMQHLLTENLVAALEDLAAGRRELLPAFDGRGDRIAEDIARLEANYRRFRTLIAGLSEEQLLRPATPANPENDYPALSLLELIERVAGHEGSHARQVSETRKYVAAFRSVRRAVTIAGLGTGEPDAVPAAVRELLSNADYVAGTAAALAVARPWIRAVALPLDAGNRAELLNRLCREARAGLWTMVVTLGDPAESAPALVDDLAASADAVSVIPAPGFYRRALERAGLSPLDAVCAAIARLPADAAGVAALAAAGRRIVALGSDDGNGGGVWADGAAALVSAGVAADAPARLVTGLAGHSELVAFPLHQTPEVAVAVDAALIVG